MIDLRQSDDGLLLPVRAQPGARRNAIDGVHDGELKVAVTQAAEKGKANRAILDVIAKSLDLRKSQVSLHLGETNRHKIVLICGVSRADLLTRLAKALGKTVKKT